ncbi:hypothetical protein CCAX7_27630 [Capsulimonas corticalis]|uniref:Uncharacterized protein n=1 Tax=Capsulimonas corticalis TaxID=2219043 RepID=A0A402CTK3_9BACT|nr:M56 family metallopeptidase [Capsulimonas corticalis]BDI30712.1 hypothetical protein CCAX7_27630 [Capsulimonas corticalis]
MLIVPFFPQLRLLVGLLAPLCIYAVWRWVVPRAGMTDPEQRCRVLWWLAFFPVACQVWVRVEPNWREDLIHSISVGVGGLNHQGIHAPPIYLSHPPTAVTDQTPCLLLAALTVLMGIRISGHIFAVGGGILDYARAALAISRLPRRAGPGLWILETTAWTAFTFGLVRPQIFISAPIWRSEHRDAVVAHERAHARRRDPLLRFLLHGMRRLFWYFPGWKPILAQAEFEAERVCDRQASAAVGRVRYTRALLAFAEHGGGSASLEFGSAFARPLSVTERNETYDLLARAHDLANPPNHHPSSRFWLWFVPIYVLINIIA